jgi:hypothetical protein
MFNPSDDLETVADGMETVTLLRRGATLGDSGTVIAHALRRAMTANEASIIVRGDVHKNVPSDGRYNAFFIAWHLPVAELPLEPRLGDIILDSAGQRWTILSFKRVTLGARWRCETKNIAVAFGLDDTIDVLKTADGSNWRTWRTGIRARIQPLETKIVTGDTPSTTTTYRIFSEENLALDHNCRIRGPDGSLYSITRSIGAERIGELQVIEVAGARD